MTGGHLEEEAKRRIALNSIVQAVERTLGYHSVHLTTDDFNALYDFIEAITTRIKETGE